MECRRNRVTTLQYIKSFGHKSDVFVSSPLLLMTTNPQLDWQHCNQLTDTIKRFIVETTTVTKTQQQQQLPSSLSWLDSQLH
mmetsp:Transcript_12627/g.25215  ORF Transcript_12627/g.25215 Transcript_12627/m.25215 type:complete len:82 (-) Transcript_12627:950-1195(-)